MGDDVFITMYKVEIAIISVVIIYQIIHSLKVYLDICKLKNIFSQGLSLKHVSIDKVNIRTFDPDLADVHYMDTIDLDKEPSSETVDGIVKLSLVDTKGKNYIITKIKKAINIYLINNYGATVNFSIIKDIIDREIEVKDEEIIQSITLPLYLGLAATMVGIIFGLFSMPELSGDGFSDGVNALIEGVKIAMIGSLSGLACTTYLSSFSYKNAKRIVQKDKNDQLTHLQANLLPELIKAEETGVSGLKASLDRFARAATEISDKVLIATNKMSENLKLQKAVMEKVDDMEVFKISKWNLELFEKMENNMDAFNNFSSYLSNMERISSQLLEFGGKISNIDIVINNIDSTLRESRDLTRFLSSHFEKIETSGNAALKAVGIAESYFDNAIKSLKERTEKMIQNLYKSSGVHETKLEDIYKKVENNLNSIASQYISAFKDAYSEAIPKFNQLDNLELIKDIKVSINNIEQDHKLVDKLDSIEENLKKGSSQNGTLTSTSGLGQKTKQEKLNQTISTKKTISFSEAIKKTFNK